MEIKQFKEIKIVIENHVPRIPKNKPGIDNKELKKVYIDGVYVGNCETFVIKSEPVLV